MVIVVRMSLASQWDAVCPPRMCRVRRFKNIHRILLTADCFKTTQTPLMLYRYPHSPSPECREEWHNDLAAPHVTVENPFAERLVSAELASMVGDIPLLEYNSSQELVIHFFVKKLNSLLPT